MERISSLNHQLTGNETAFTGLTMAPPDGILGVKTAYLADKNPNKINVSIGIYRDENGKPKVLDSVRKAEALLLQDKSLNKDYLPITGDKGFIKASQKLIFGENSPALAKGVVGTVQSLSGTGALKLCFEFIRKHRPAPIYIPNPTWGNHKQLINYAMMDYRLYPYWNESTKGFDIDGMLNTLRSAPTGSIFLLHPCAHNPTGCDPTKAQWKQIAAVVKEMGHLPLFDSAYQGFATGDFVEDAFSIRYFVEQDIKFFLCQSFSKNFGLYGERAGCFHAFTNSPDQAKKFVSRVAKIIRTTYSNPPKHGAYIVKTICNNPELYQSFLAELKEMSGRIISMRKALHHELTKLNTPGNWDHIITQIGMFSFTGLNKAQCKKMIDKWHVYLISNGRISMAGLNHSNVAYLAKAIDDCVRN